MNEIDELTEQVKEHLAEIYQSGWSKGYEQGYRNGVKEYMETHAKPSTLQSVGFEGIGSVETPKGEPKVPASANVERLPVRKCPHRIKDLSNGTHCGNHIGDCPPGVDADCNLQVQYGYAGTLDDTRESLTGASVKAAISTTPVPAHGAERTFTDKQGNRVR